MSEPATPKKSGQKQVEVSKKKLPIHLDPSQGKATQFKPGQSGNPNGRPKGAISLSTRIQNMLNDENFETYLPDARDGFKHFKGAPAQAIIQTAMIKAMQGDTKSADWLAKYGYGTKVELSGEDGGPVSAVVRIVRSGDDTSNS